MRWHIYKIHTFDYVIEGIFKECEKTLPNEASGYLIGMFSIWNGKHFILIDNYIPVESHSTEYYGEMDITSIGEALRKFMKSFGDTKHLIIGWYHSHPGYGIFISDIDLRTQTTFFTQPFHVALVVDPINREYGFFKTSDNRKSILRASFAIWRKRV